MTSSVAMNIQFLHFSESAVP